MDLKSQIAEFASQGISQRGIAKKLSVSISTVRYHLGLKKKTFKKSVRELVEEIHHVIVK